MKPIDLRWWAGWNVVILLAACAAMAWLPIPYLAIALMALLCGGLRLGTIYLSRVVGDPLDVDTRIAQPAEAGVDPWAMQRHLMQISGQDLPRRPQLTKYGLMYAALIAEESAETIQALVAPMDRLLDLIRQPGATSISEEEIVALKVIRGRLQVLQFSMAGESKTIRQQLAKIREFSYDLKLEEAMPLLDGHGDSVVVNCGFALAMGLPGAEGYAEIGESNASKANPTTGLIDKTPDGKWIKGANYRAPNLEEVLRGI